MANISNHPEKGNDFILLEPVGFVVPRIAEWNRA
jgi:hypothetical protein